MEFMKLWLRLFTFRLFEGDEEGGGSSEGGEGGASGGTLLEQAAASLENGDGEAGASGDGGQGSPAAYMTFGENGAIGDRPDWAPENFWSAEKGLDVSKAMGSYTEARAKMDQAIRSGQQLDKDGALDSPDKYVEKWVAPAAEEGQDISRWGDLSSDDPGVSAWSQVAHRHGLSPDRANAMMRDFMQFSNEHLAEPFNQDAQWEALGGEERGKKMLASVAGDLKAMTGVDADTPGVLNQQEYQALLRFGADADTISAMSKLMREVRGGSSLSIPTGGVALSDAPSAEEVHAMQGAVVESGPHKGELRYGVDSAYAAKVDKAWEMVYGTGQTRTSSRLPIPGGNA